MYQYDKDSIKNNLTIDEILRLVAELGGEPMMGASGNFFTSRTICHNHLGEGSRKLYYYDNTKLFQCYTDCGNSFDIFELISSKEILVCSNLFTSIPASENSFNMFSKIGSNSRLLAL